MDYQDYITQRDLRQEAEAGESVVWGDTIPFMGEVMPEGSDWAGADADCMAYDEWLEVWGND